MKKDFRAQESRTTIYVTFRIFLNELFHFTKYVLRLIIKRKRFKRNVEFVRSIYEDRRIDQLKNYKLTTLDDYIYGSPTALEETKRWNLYNGKLRFGYHKQIQEKKTRKQWSFGEQKIGRVLDSFTKKIKNLITEAPQI